MSYQHDRDEFVATMSKAGYALSEIRSLLRSATTSERVNYLISCVEMSDKEQARIERADERAEERARKILEIHGHTLITSGDPRGYALRVGKLGKFNTWGGEESGYGIPAKEYR